MVTKMPKAIEVKKDILNIQNKDHKDLIYCILASKHPAAKHAYRPNKYNHIFIN